MDAEYENVSNALTRKPSTEPMLMTRDGEVPSGPAAASSSGVRSWVMVKGRVRLRVRTRVHALSGN